MSTDIFKFSIPELEALEDIQLSKFDSDVAWEMGTLARSLAVDLFSGKGVVIDISLASGQILFHTTTSGKLTTSDNDEWAKRKSRTVVRFGKSSFYMGSKLRIKKLPIEQVYFISSSEFCTHGGSIPVRVKGCDSVIATLTISGLAQEQDHMLGIQILKEIAGKY